MAKAKMKKQNNKRKTSVVEDMEQLEFLYTASGSVNWHNYSAHGLAVSIIL